MRYKGEITVFLSLLFSILSALTITVVESARAQAIRAQTERVMQTSIHSSFGEYNQDLLSYYGIFAIDSSYRGSSGSVDHVREHLAEYAHENFRSSDPTKQKSDWNKIRVEKTEIRIYQLLSDREGDVLTDQAVKYELDKGALPDRSQVLRAKSNMRTDGGSSFLGEFAQMLSRAGDVPDNPAGYVFECATGRDLLDMVLGGSPETGTVPADRASARSLDRGTYSGQLSVADADFLFDVYLQDVFGTYVEPKSHAVHACEQEYLISGKTKMADSLRDCAQKIVAQREERNLNGFFGNGRVLQETEELAAELCAEGDGDPYYVQMSLLYAWAYAESVVECSRLLHGGRAEMEGYSDPQTVPLRDLRDFVSYCGSCGGRGDAYADYLTGLLALTGRKQKVMRCMDLLEINIRHAGHAGFSVDKSVTYFKAKMSVDSSYGHGCEVEREYGYMIP